MYAISLGTGDRNLWNQPVLVQGKRMVVPTWTVLDFCQHYCLSRTIQDLLVAEGFENTGGLLEVSPTDLSEAKFKQGQIAEIKRALKDFLDENGIAIAPSKTRTTESEVVSTVPSQ
jgi:hypothetical protein